MLLSIVTLQKHIHMDIARSFLADWSHVKPSGGALSLESCPDRRFKQVAFLTNPSTLCCCRFESLDQIRCDILAHSVLFVGCPFNSIIMTSSCTLTTADICNQQCHLDESSGVELISVSNLSQTMALLHLLEIPLMQLLCSPHLIGPREARLLSCPSREALHILSGASNLTLHLLPGACKRRSGWGLWSCRCGHWSICQHCIIRICLCSRCNCTLAEQAPVSVWQVQGRVLPGACNWCSCWRRCIRLCGYRCFSRVSAHGCSCIG